MTSSARTGAEDPSGLAQRLASLPWIAGVAVAGIVGDPAQTASAGVADAETER